MKPAPVNEIKEKLKETDKKDSDTGIRGKKLK